MGSDPYRDGTCQWWHLAGPSPELLDAHRSGWLGPPGVAIDLGCGLGSEIGYLAAAGWKPVGTDLSGTALGGAAALHRSARFIQSDVRRLPIRDGRADLLLDRGCFHYLTEPDRELYAQEAWRVLRPGGGLLLRACLTSAGLPNGLNEAVISQVFSNWHQASLTARNIRSATRSMPALIVRLNRR
jgi:SAM-dependent methyltransferase